MLGREEAIEGYALYRIRLFEYLHTFQVLDEIMRGTYSPQNPLGHGRREFIQTFRSFLNGIFASLMDKDDRALRVFEVWPVLFPHHEPRIAAVWNRISAHESLIRDYRNKVAFHVQNDIAVYTRTRDEFRKCGEIVEVMQEFWDLARDLMKEEPKTLPRFREELVAILAKKRPDWDQQQIEGICNYIIESTPAEP